MASEIDLVDIGGGNIGSVRRCLERMGVRYREASIDSPPSGDRPLLLPGVGAFGPVMQHLRKSNFEPKLKALIKNGTPYLGICIGMQILFDGSEEAENCPGLAIIPGEVVAFTSGKVPQIGWNLIEPKFDGQQEGYVYFVNSYYPKPVDERVVSYSANYYVPFCAAVKDRNITAFQFHPEKSGDFGQTLLRRWLDENS
jgi:glutamine amidotransferase